jgi:hypothetical protein
MNRMQEGQYPVQPASPVHEQVGALVARYLDPPSASQGSRCEDAAHDRWRTALVRDLLQARGDFVSREPEAVRFVELILYRMGVDPRQRPTDRPMPLTDTASADFRRGLLEYWR